MWHGADDRDVVMLVASDSRGVRGKPVGAMSDAAMADAADATMEMLRAQLGRAPTLEEVQRAMVEIAAIVLGKLHAEERALNSSEAPSVEGPHDDADSSREVRAPAPRRGRRR